MCRMKKFILSALALCFYLACAIFPLAYSPVRADTQVADAYACVLCDDAFFYANKDENQGLFLLPKSYFVKILQTETEFTKIEYQTDGEHFKTLTGYAKTSKLTPVDYVPKTPYLNLTFDVKYKLEDTSLGPSFLNELVITCAYYGDYKIGSKTYCYVLRDETFGYVLKPTTLVHNENPEYTDNLKSQTPAPDTEDTSSQTEPQNSSSPAQIAILVSVCLLVPVVAGLILKAPRKPPYEDD